MLKAALIGVGKWAHGGWFQTLLDGAGSSLLELSIVDVEASIPAHIAKDPRSHLVTYVSQQEQQSIPILDLAVIAVPAKLHLECIEKILPRVRPGGSVLCEKPGGDSMIEFKTMWNLCRQHDVEFAISDHYLVRSAVQSLFVQKQDIGVSVRDAKRVIATMTETQPTGPDQNVDFDMTVHLLNLIHVLFPTGTYEPTLTMQSHATVNAHVDVTYSLSQGDIAFGTRKIPCQVEVGKQMPQDCKQIVIESSSGDQILDLSYSPGWRYDRIIHDVASGIPITNGRGQNGAVPPVIAQQTWKSMERARGQAQKVPAYSPRSLPELKGIDRWHAQTRDERPSS